MGDRKKLGCVDMEERYSNLCRVAMTRSIISLGLSTFKNDGGGRFSVQTFNVMILCNEDYIVEPASLQFLVHHGFDFDKQYSKGLPYYRGDDKEVRYYKLVQVILREMVVYDFFCRE